MVMLPLPVWVNDDVVVLLTKEPKTDILPLLVWFIIPELDILLVVNVKIPVPD